mmetsp:Transcript_8924/g.13403  ORF Transcript_8924/g.13403 Transcript_8924/m.13403 type:complete len:478 (-) Transcript_8924:84-1517(-)
MSLSLSNHNGRQLTEAEVKLVEFFDNRSREKHEARQAQIRQQKHLAQSVNYVIEESSRLREPVDAPKGNDVAQRKVEPASTAPENSSATSIQRKVDSPPEDDISKIKRRRLEEHGNNKKADSRVVRSEDTTVNNADSSSNIVPTKVASRARYNITQKESYKEVATDELDGDMFPSMGLLLTEDWNPQKVHSSGGTAKEFLLDDFSVLKNQTLAFKITVPSSSRRWSINIGPEEMLNRTGSGDNDNELCSHLLPGQWSEVYFHFNPRYESRRREILQNDMSRGLWGLIDRRSFAAFNVLPTGTFTLVIQIRADGFYTSVNGMFLTFFAHRRDRDMSEHRRLALQLGLADDKGTPESVIFHKVWWGRRDPKTTVDFIGFTAAAKDSTIDEDQARSLFVGGLPKSDTAEDLEELLWDIFGEYDMEIINIIPSRGYAFLKMSTVANALDAIASCNGYSVENIDDPNDQHKLIVSHSRSRSS